MSALCNVEGCDLPATASRGMCRAHYMRWWAYGDPLAGGVPKPRREPGAVCAADGCAKPARKREWCQTHYQRWRAHGDPLAGARVWQPDQCTVPDCDGPTAGGGAHGWCHMHYKRWWKHGDPLAVLPSGRPGGPPMCTAPGCGEASLHNGLCSPHYHRQRRHGDPLGGSRSRSEPPPDGLCTEPDCDRPHTALGWCRAHYYRLSDAGRASTRTGVLRRRARKRGADTRQVTTDEVARIRRCPCMACGSVTDVEVDHLIPLARGGRHAVGNLAPLCRLCNASKGARTWAEWRASGVPRAVLSFGDPLREARLRRRLRARWWVGARDVPLADLPGWEWVA